MAKHTQDPHKGKGAKRFHRHKAEYPRSTVNPEVGRGISTHMQMTLVITADVSPEGKRGQRQWKDIFMVTNASPQLRIIYPMKTSFKTERERETFSGK